ncbi:hypothetical protein BT63DRAFT_454518 [Microthyrium microscopicum]|uniref:Ecp2 effector protein domain-containing protein n=1 Tax=Microthyrium microscopicum TaxID=703497 RepID=A0A6A6UEV6_9PEZI|nr:hypothetical protein BT63DRAFT_454518 [Microthyrium microscopicum]
MRLIPAVASFLAVGMAFEGPYWPPGQNQYGYPLDANDTVIQYPLRYPSVPLMKENCRAKEVASCTRDQYRMVFRQHWIVGVEEYCPTNDTTNCWSWKDLGYEGEKLKDALDDSWCMITQYSFHWGWGRRKEMPPWEHRIAAPSGFFWSATFRASVGCDTKDIRRRMDRFGVPHERHDGDVVLGLENSPNPYIRKLEAQRKKEEAGRRHR